jgi:hypothetical protein
MGYHMLELNASDTRSKKSIEALLTDLSKSINIKGSFKKGEETALNSKSNKHP